VTGRALRPLTPCLAVLICLTLIGGTLGATRRSTVAESEAELGPAPVYSGQPRGTAGRITSAAVGATVNPGNRAASAAFYNNQYVAPGTPVIGWMGSFPACNPSSTSAAFKDAILQRIVYFRAMAGVPTNIAFSSTYNSKDQRAALMMGKAGQLSHNPDASWPCYAAHGDEAAGASNLALGRNGPAAIDLYIWDFGASNYSVGHRRWLLYPPTTTFGTGDVPDPDGAGSGNPFRSANALWVFNNVGDSRPATRDDFVAWPPKGYVPYQVVWPRWSFSYPGADFTGATVTVTSFGASIPVNLEAVYPAPGSGLIVGEPTIVWRLNDQNSASGPTAVARDTRYKVRIENVVVNGTPRTFAYDVIVFDPATPAPPKPVCYLSRIRGKVGSSLTATCQDFEPNETVNIYWDSSNSTVRDSFVASNSGTGLATFNVPASKLGSHRVVAKGQASGLLTTPRFEVLPGASLTPTSGPVGTRVTIKATGFDAGEPISFKWYNLQGTVSTVLKSNQITSSVGNKTVVVTIPNDAAGTHRIRVFNKTGRYTDINFTLTVPAISSVPDPTITPTPKPTRTPAAAPTAQATGTPAPSPTPTETPAPEPTPTETPTPEPTATDTPTPEPTATETPEPTPTETPLPEIEATETEPAADAGEGMGD
jgi:hypothetical protein